MRMFFRARTLILQLVRSHRQGPCFDEIIHIEVDEITLRIVSVTPVQTAGGMTADDTAPIREPRVEDGLLE